MRPQALASVAAAAALAACAASRSQEVAPGNWPVPAVSRVPIFKCGFVRLPCDARRRD